MDGNINTFDVNAINVLNNILSVINSDLENTINESFNETKVIKKPLAKDYKENLEKYIVKSSDVGEIKCAICQDDFEEGETVIKLDCDSESPHFFHLGEDKDMCCGIYPWFEENNTCPVCRKEFPYEEEPVQEEEPFQEEQAVQEEEHVQEEQHDPMVIRLNPFFSSILLNHIQQQQRDESDEEEINQEDNPFLHLINNTLSEVIEERQLEEAIQRSMEEI